jgi:hypothetical protein
VERFDVNDQRHVNGPVAYPQTPPVGGAHAPVWQNCGFYETTVANETAVHSLEHGAVWITYRPNLPMEQIDVLRQIAAREPFVLISPYPELTTQVVASAWSLQLRLEAASDPRLMQFVRAFQRGPQTPEPGAPCTGGIVEPE